MKELSPCPYCGGQPELVRVGDDKQYVIYRCSQCHKTPVKNGDARLTPCGARRMWNRAVSYVNATGGADHAAD